MITRENFIAQAVKEAERKLGVPAGWRTDHIGDKDEHGRHYYTAQAIEDFLEHVADGNGFSDGAEGDCFAWAFHGNHIDMDAFVEGIRPFITATGRLDATTILFDAHTTSGRTYVFKYDGSDKVKPITAPFHFGE